MNFHGMGRQIEFSGNFFIGISIQQKLEDCALTSGQRSFGAGEAPRGLDPLERD